MIVIPWLLGIVLVVAGIVALRRREMWGIALIVLGVIVVPGGLWIFD
jgi:hypothetical protein